MSEIKPESIYSFLGFKPEEIKTEEDFKNQFESVFARKESLLKDPEFTNKIYGQRVGSIETKAKSWFKKMGVDFNNEETKHKQIEEILELGFNKIADLNKKAIDDLEKSTKGTVEDQVKEWKDKYSTIQNKLKDTEGLLQKTTGDFDIFKKDLILKEKNNKLDKFKTELFSKLEFKQDITPIEKKGFEFDLQSKYDFDFDESDSIFVKDKKSGNRIASKKVTGKFVEPLELFNDELIANNLHKKNKDGGKPLNKAIQIPSNNNPQSTNGLYIHPSALSASQSAVKVAGA